MKKSVLKTIAVTALVFGMTASAAFARSPAHSNPNEHHPMNGAAERDFDGQFPGPVMGHMMDFGHMGIEWADILGTVTSISEDKKIITVKDIDGKETLVHVNPFTKIDLPCKKPDMRAEKKGMNRMPDECTFSDVKAGDYVAVRKMKTDTKVVEASRIFIAKADKEEM